MAYTQIAPVQPFAGAPRINLASVFGASPRKPFLLRIPVTGERPVAIEAQGLPDGLALDGNILSGSVLEAGDYPILLVATNRLGRAERRVTLEIRPGNVLVTPLLGFTSWNAFGSAVRQEDILTVARRLVDLGIAEYGYAYVNIDSGWQGVYGGPFDAIQPNAKFPDMAGLTAQIHALGLKTGIYSTPMLKAWGCPKELKSIPGCTTGDPDPRFASINGGIGLVRKERNNARQWEAWGFDYLKYDWRPTDPVNAEAMRAELAQLGRDFGFCVTVYAMQVYHEYWSRFCNSYRANADSDGTWKCLLSVYDTYLQYYPYVTRGHYFDLDMLDTGTCRLRSVKGELTEDEQIVAFSMRAFFNSPIQISSTLEEAGPFELALYCNEEILAINQDAAFCTATPVLKEETGALRFHVFEKRLENDDYAYAAFNMGEEEAHGRLAFAEETRLRDVWTKADMGSCRDWDFALPPHTVRIVRASRRAVFPDTTPPAQSPR